MPSTEPSSSAWRLAEAGLLGGGVAELQRHARSAAAATQISET